MAKRRTNKLEIPSPTELTLSREEFKTKIEERVSLGELILNFEVRTQQDFEKNTDEFFEWNDYNSEFLKQAFNNEYNEYKKSYDNAGSWGGFMVLEGKNPTPAEKLKDKVECKVKNLRKLATKTELLKCSIENSVSENIPIEKQIGTNNIFIVHGHDNRTKIEIARTVEKLGLTPIILHEQPNEGRTIIEKFEAYSNVGFAIVLLTRDDLGRVKTSKNDASRARQNVILEMGYFIGALSRSRVFPLYEKGVELPSDLYGLLYNPIDDAGNWKFSLVKELGAAGYNVDANKIL